MPLESCKEFLAEPEKLDGRYESIIMIVMDHVKSLTITSGNMKKRRRERNPKRTTTYRPYENPW